MTGNIDKDTEILYKMHVLFRMKKIDQDTFWRYDDMYGSTDKEFNELAILQINELWRIARDEWNCSSEDFTLTPTTW